MRTQLRISGRRNLADRLASIDQLFNPLHHSRKRSAELFLMWHIRAPAQNDGKRLGECFLSTRCAILQVVQQSLAIARWYSCDVVMVRLQEFRAAGDVALPATAGNVKGMTYFMPEDSGNAPIFGDHTRRILPLLREDQQSLLWQIHAIHVLPGHFTRPTARMIARQ